MNFSEIGWARAGAIALFASIVVTAAVAALRERGALEAAELRLHDKVRSAFVAGPPTPDVAVVTIDDTDLDTWGWPLPDATLAALVTATARAGAQVIGVDIYRDRPVGSGQRELEAAFQTTGAIAIHSLGETGQPGIPPPAFALASGHHGFSDTLVDDDGVARRALLLVTDEGGTSLSFALKLAMAATGQVTLEAWPDDPTVIAFGQRPITRLTDGFGPYRGLDDAGYQTTITYEHALPGIAPVKARDLLAGLDVEGALAGKVVIIGTASVAIKDNFRTPLDRAGGGTPTLGVEVHAAVVQQLIDAWHGRTSALRSPPTAWQIAALFAAAIAGAGLAAILRHPLAILAAGPGLALAAGGATAMTLAGGLWLPALPIALAWFGSSLVTFAALRLLDGARHRAVARLFADHLSPALAEQVWRNRDVILNGGKPAPLRMQATVLFADLAGSTTVGGGAEPQAYMAWVSTYLDMISDIAHLHGGFVEKFTGDGIMIVFGAPLPSVDEAGWRRDAGAACRCALAIADATRARNEAGSALAPYRVRIGIHSGVVFGGTIGNRGAMRYNVMGDTVNIAARVEAFGKTVPDRLGQAHMICLTGTAAMLARDVAQTSSVGTLQHDDGRSAFEVFRLTGVTE